MGPGLPWSSSGRMELRTQTTKGPVRLSRCGEVGPRRLRSLAGWGAVSMKLSGVAEVKEHRRAEVRQRSGAGTVSMELPGVAEVKEHHGVGVAEAEEPCEAGAVSVELRWVAKVEEHCRVWAAEAEEPHRVRAGAWSFTGQKRLGPRGLEGWRL